MHWQARHLLILVAVVACGPERSETVAPEPTTTVPDPEPLGPPPLEDPEPDRVSFEVPDSPNDLPELTELERGRRILSRTAAWSTPNHPNPVVQHRLAMLFEHIAYARAFTSNWGGDGYWSDARPYGGCRPVLATENVISVLCYRSSTHRGGNTSESPASHVHLSVVGDTVVPFTQEEIFKEGTDLTSLVTEEQCVESVLASGVRRMLAIRGCREMLPAPRQWVMGPTGFTTTVDRRTGEPGFSLPYGLFREHLRPDGPIAWLFAGQRPRPWASEEDARGYALSGFLPWPELVTLASKLPRDALTEIRAQRLDETGRLVLPFTNGEDLVRARELADTLDTNVRRARWPDRSLDELRPVRARETLALYTNVSASESVRRVVPAGTHLISVQPPTRVDDIRVVGGLELVGFARQAKVESDDACRPDPRAFLDAFEPSQRDDAVHRLQVATTEIRTRADNPPKKIALFASTTGGRTRIRIVEATNDCALGETLLDEESRGHLFDLRLGTLSEDGESFLLVGVYQGEERRRYLAYRMSSEANQRRVLADLLEVEDLADQESDPTSHVHMGGEGEGFRPVVLGEQDYRWNGRTLVAIDHGDRGY